VLEPDDDRAIVRVDETIDGKSLNFVCGDAGGADDFMAFNHNGTSLMKVPGTQKEAERKARAYHDATGNATYVEQIGDDEDDSPSE
jgi:hypothetical protein